MLTVQDIAKRYSQPVLDQLSFSVAAGEIVGVVGKSGSGKSTLLRLLNLIEQPDQGEIIIDGQKVNQFNQKQRLLCQREIGMVFQQYNLLSNLSVFDNVYLPLKLAGRSSEPVGELLAFVGMSDKAQDYPATLSGGEKQRVAIARALVREPKILLCDEPTSALDEDTKQDIIALLQKVQQTFKPAVVFVSHELSVVRQLCHRVYVLESGRFTAEFVHQPQPINTSALSYVEQVERSLRHVDQ
ncbi:ATP-binding cassette domain-containing protein [Enterococcus sp.]|uniref:ATP-binding cassette domain-containing protein n=1 Tax=Enterococcus sp. TaxID=35783 RepID=UPI0028AB05B8|nr:ATP-binding cassette domain-containing protein [Enterococcus sp.]